MKEAYWLHSWLRERQLTYPMWIMHDYLGIGHYALLAKRQGLMYKRTKVILTCHSNTRLSDEYNRRFGSGLDSLVHYYQEAEMYRTADVAVSTALTMYAFVLTVEPRLCANVCENWPSGQTPRVRLPCSKVASAEATT